MSRMGKPTQVSFCGPCNHYASMHDATGRCTTIGCDCNRPEWSDHNQAYLARLRTLDSSTLAEMYLELRLELHKPPEGWVVFGSHSGMHSEELAGIKLEFWGVGEDGLPLWERAVKP